MTQIVEVDMLTEFDVRNEMDAISRAEIHPVRKASRLIEISRALRSQVRRLSQGARILSRDTKDEEADRMERTVLRLANLNCEVLDFARRLLARAQQPELNLDRYSARHLS